MLYTVQYVRDGELETHHNLTKKESDLLSQYIRRTFRVLVSVERQEKMITESVSQ